MILATESGSLELVKLLLDAGTDINYVPTENWTVGMKIEGNYRGRGKWFPGKIKKVLGIRRYDIEYDDGESEAGVSRDTVRILGSVSAQNDKVFLA